MYCPICGNELREVGVEIPDDTDVNWDDPKEVDNYMELQDKKSGAVDMVCTSDRQCFGEGFPLTFHHPLKGMKSAPGDSWSLTWLK